MKPFFYKVLPHLVIVLGCIIASLAYFSPVISGKKIRQSDIVQYSGMAKQQTDFRNKTGEEPYWIDNAFGGMVSYQVGAQYDHDYIKKLDRLIRFLPRPADYLFLYFIGFYVLLLVLKVDYKLAFLGSLAFGFSTYFIIILGVGHNAKAHAIGYMPLVLSGIILTFRGRYFWGGVLLAITMALEIAANHVQMTYYLFLLVVVLGVVYLVDAVKHKKVSQFFKAIGTMVVAVLFSILLNATPLLATKQYASYSTRGNTGVTITPNGKEKKNTGLDYDYITQYSYGIVETFNLFIPRFMGGASSEDVGSNSNIYKELLTMGASPSQAREFSQNVPTYWGDQPIVAGPAYIGAVLIFLFVLSLYLVKGRLKWWLLGGSILALLLSWGKNLGFVTNFFIDYVPMYDKFRAVSSIQVLIELCIPILAILGLQQLFSRVRTNDEKMKALKMTTIILGSIAFVFLLFNSLLFSFKGAQDSIWIEQYGPDFVRALREDRKSIFTTDVIRTLVFILATAVVCWLFLKDKLKQSFTILILGVLILTDLISVDRKYVNNDNFVSARTLSKPFTPTAADQEILKDTSHYRVYDVTGDPFNGARTSYFHNALGGYHAAKPGRVQDIYDFYLAKGDMNILNMFNVKYFIIPHEKQGAVVQENQAANGNAWFVEEIISVATADEELLALQDVNTKTTAVINQNFNDKVLNKNFSLDSTAQITLVSHKPNKLVYTSQNSTDGFSVFSENYYPGWQAYIDQKPVDHVQTNFLLRGLLIPKGKHTITFKFEPKIIQTGNTITSISALLFLILLGIGAYLEFKKRNKHTILNSEA
ncbi:YfhO family protein [Aquimarina sp. W85]|uniref:YfhO family protein n=1 Tax=Aquimarina rhodophyticola TaxID=3342246 RepID=UPI0036720CE9